MIVVADTSVLLNLCRIGEEDLLWQLFGQVTAPAKVKDEFERAVSVYERFSRLMFPSFITVHEPSASFYNPLAGVKLDPGESAAIALTLELRADLLLMDERKGRRAASELGIAVTGILGLLIQAKKRAFLPSVSAVLNRLRTDAGFFLSDDQVSKTLLLADESA
jgi:uncharacterized protein